ncbi:hypothetical protein HNR23_002249 [Nocardiopsis mwathae]|uniref:Uncharacterized protein n=1 Tax=Nocardiopsis mwathae TaxID=1472723 RepID=A0A7X0D6J5_9ACTN|nr:hypothetical protein [Nocardiopsis mwathae]
MTATSPARPPRPSPSAIATPLPPPPRGCQGDPGEDSGCGGSGGAGPRWVGGGGVVRSPGVPLLVAGCPVVVRPVRWVWCRGCVWCGAGGGFCTVRFAVRCSRRCSSSRLSRFSSGATWFVVRRVASARRSRPRSVARSHWVVGLSSLWCDVSEFVVWLPRIWLMIHQRRHVPHRHRVPGSPSGSWIVMMWRVHGPKSFVAGRVVVRVGGVHTWRRGMERSWSAWAGVAVFGGAVPLMGCGGYQGAPRCPPPGGHWLRGAVLSARHSPLQRRWRAATTGDSALACR